MCKQFCAKLVGRGYAVNFHYLTGLGGFMESSRHGFRGRCVLEHYTVGISFWKMLEVVPQNEQDMSRFYIDGPQSMTIWIGKSVQC